MTEGHSPNPDDDYVVFNPSFHRYLCERVCEASLPEAAVILHHLALHSEDEERSGQIRQLASVLSELHQILIDGLGQPPIKGTRLWRAINSAPISQVAFEVRSFPANQESHAPMDNLADAIDVKTRQIAAYFRDLRLRSDSENT